MKKLGNMNKRKTSAKPHPNQTWKHTIEPQKLLDETWKQIGSIERVQMRMENKARFIHCFQCA
jgi:hypothetical protein